MLYIATFISDVTVADNSACGFQVSEVPDKEVLEEEQLEGLAACCCELKRCIRVAVLPDQQ